ncbi:MAG: hypothetical protein Q8Q31_01170 [Nanoarchaeota archaeon]|nr:hypothetical protein [Nanoarchaeota archaeon]
MAKSKKIAKKTFFDVKAPITSAKISLYASSLEELDGKIITLDLTRSLRGKSFELKLKVKKDQDSLTSEPIGLELMGSYIRKMIRGGTDYVEDSFKVESKDGLVIVKPFMITRKKVSRGVRNKIREATKKHLESHIKTRTTKELFNEVITNKIQKDLSLKIKKIYPLALCELRTLKIVEEKK